MRVACPTCHSEYNIDERRVPPGGLNVRCPKCQGAFPVRPPPPGAGAVPLPAGARRPARQSGVPLPPPESAPAGSTMRFTPPPAPPPVAAPQAPARGMTMLFEKPVPDGAPGAAPGGDVFAAAPDESPFAAEADESPFARPGQGGAAIGPPPPPAPAGAVGTPLGFGEIDIDGGAAPAPLLGHADEPFPFDTTEAASANPFATAREDPFASAAPRADDDAPFVEAEPSPEAAPASPAAPAAGRAGGLGALGAKETEELEMLFDDGSGKRARAPAAAGRGGAGVFKVRRRSGKIFGPFTEAEVIEMLGRGELLGNEDVSPDDGATFGAIGAMPAFGDAMRRLMESPQLVAGARVTPVVEAPPRAKPADRASFVSRMAPARFVEGARAAAGWRHARLAVAGGALALALAVGFAAGLTPYGVFFYRLALGHTGANRPGAALLAEARGRLADDGFGGVKGALDLADRALRVQASDREAKAVYVVAASLLARRHGGGADAWARAKAYLPELTDKLSDDPEAAKAVLAASLVGADRPGSAAAAAAVHRHVAKHPRDEDALAL
ncbi:MAG TPA: zinc-ribbon domain-containing protein, partial [Anaeromyxobacteraceae bacterium]